MNNVLKIKNLHVSFEQGDRTLEAVCGMSLSIDEGEVVALVGESGCGKSVTAQSILKLNDSPTIKTKAELLTLCGRDIMSASEKDMLSIRGALAGMIFQDPMTYLNPTMKVGNQVTEALLRRGIQNREGCKKEALRLLEMVQIPEPTIRANQYPYQYSGGMRQRAMIAMALACSPKLLIADEPTTALDPTIQLQILVLLKKMQLKLGTAILLITHDLSVVANVADRVAVMYGGKIVEEASVAQLFHNPVHPYTRGLLRSLPSIDTGKELYAIQGVPPDLYSLPKGCAFAPRCEFCMHICGNKIPINMEVDGTHTASCWLLHKDCPKGGV